MVRRGYILRIIEELGAALIALLAAYLTGFPEADERIEEIERVLVGLEM